MAVALPAVLLGALVPTTTQELIHLFFQHRLQHLASALADEGFEDIIGCRHWRGRWQNLIR